MYDSGGGGDIMTAIGSLRTLVVVVTLPINY